MIHLVLGLSLSLIYSLPPCSSTMAGRSSLSQREREREREREGERERKRERDRERDDMYRRKSETEVIMENTSLPSRVFRLRSSIRD